MKKLNFNIKKIILVCITLTVLFSALLTLGAMPAHAQSESMYYITTAEEFKDAITSGQKTIYVGDITFETLETVMLNHSIKLIGKSERSVIKNLCFKITGSLTCEDKPKLSFENIKFDGGFDKTKFDLTQEKPFDEVFGAEGNRRFLSNDVIQKYMGYFDIDINNCEITNYIGEKGAVIYLPDDLSENGEKKVSIKNSRIYGNVGAYKIICISNRAIKFAIENAEMYDNYAVSQMASITLASTDINGLHIYGNHFLPLNSEEYFAEENSMHLIRGGGIYFGDVGGTVKNMTVEDCEAYYGGGAFVALAKKGGKKLVFADCTFKNNRAKVCGGAVGVESYIGYPVYFTNCQFIGNTAPTGGSICAKPFARDRADGNTSLIEFSFCDFSGNTAEDDKALSYYLYGFTQTKTDGKIVVRACRIEDSTFLNGNGEKENNYNIVSPTATTDDSDIKVPAEEYTLWANGYYSGKTEERSIGYTEPQSGEISPVQPILYGICAALSIFIALFYIIKSTEKHIDMIFIAVSVAVINIGYLLLSISGNITSALIYNNIAYLGNAFLPLFFMVAVANVCRYKVKKISKVILSAITVVNFLFTLTVWFSEWFYKDPTYAVIKGAVDIIKENGVLNLIYKLYVFAYFIVIFGIVLYSLIKKQLEHKKYGLLIFSAELVCLLVWTVEMFVFVNYELLSAAYMLTSLLMTVLFFEMEKYGILISVREVLMGENEQTQEASKDSSALQTDAEKLEKVCNLLVERKLLSKREVEVLALVMQEKSTDKIVEALFISNNTVKYHIKNIYAKLSVKNREELRFRIANELQQLK